MSARSRRGFSHARREGFVVWFTGLSGSGKSTLAAMLSAELRSRGVPVELLDGDEVRAHLSKDLGFSKEDRDTNVHRVGFVAKLIARAGACAIAAGISPYRAARDEVRAAIPRFVEVYCSSSIEALAERDPKGLYRRALAGEIRNFTGIDDPYEAPEHPDVTVHTDRESKEASLAAIVLRLEELGYVLPGGPGLAAQELPERRLVEPHGGELTPRLVSGDARDDLAREAAALFAVELDELAASDLDLLADGALSPLRGFMGSKDYLRVVHEMRLENGLPWPVPVTLAVSTEEASRIAIGARIALRAGGAVAAVLEVSDRWTPDRELEAERVHGSRDAGHPGAARLRARAPVYVGGEVEILERGSRPEALRTTPAALRAELSRRGWTRVAGFATRAPMHRPEEHLTKAALEGCHGLVVHALPGGDHRLGVLTRCHQALAAGYFPEGRVLLATLGLAPRHAGAREALFDALVQKNHGVSHAVRIGPAGPAGSGDLEEHLDAFGPGELGVTLLCFEPAFYSTALGAMGTCRTAPGAESTRIAMEPREIAALIARGHTPPVEVCRPEIVEVLRRAAEEGRG